jgi:hypothetical protein
VVEIINAFQTLNALNKLAGMSDEFEFFSADEFISDDLDRPTILQNIVSARLPPGHRASLSSGLPPNAIPGFDTVVFTEATGFFAGERFRGLLSFDYRYTFLEMPRTGNPMIDRALQQMPRELQVAGEGEFDLTIVEP